MELLDLLSLEGLKTRLLKLPNLSARDNRTNEDLRLLSRPGAWLLDYTYTIQYVLHGDVTRKFTKRSYMAVPNGVLAHIARFCFADCQRGCKKEERLGYEIEHAAWLALEADECCLVVALAWHARRLRDADVAGWPRRRADEAGGILVDPAAAAG